MMSTMKPHQSTAAIAMIVLAAFLTWWVWDRTGLDPLLVGVLVCPVMYGLGWLLYRGVVARLARLSGWRKAAA